MKAAGSIRAKTAVALAVLLVLAARGASAVDYPSALPAEADARKALSESPQLQAAREMLAISDAQRRQIQAGSHEWTIGVLGQKRTDAVGATFSEQSYELSRGVRWLGKAGIDRALGEQVAAVGEHAYSDSWHEAARTLLSGWFEWLRAKRAAQIADSQIAVLEQQVSTVQSRVRSGDAARLEQSLAQTELDRGVSAQAAARLKLQELALVLKRTFPDLALAEAIEPGTPQMPPGTDEYWTQRIAGHNHEIELAEGQYEQARLAAQRASRDRIADPSVALRFSNNLDGNDRVIGVAVTLPIGGARRTAESAIARGEANIAAQRVREVRLKVESDAQQAVLAMRSAHAQWQRLAAAAERTTANAELVKRGYALGEFTTTELLTARRQAIDASLTAAVAQLTAIESTARVQLDAHEIWSLESVADAKE